MYVRLGGKKSKIANGLRIINPKDHTIELILEPAPTVTVDDGDVPKKTVAKRENED